MSSVLSTQLPLALLKDYNLDKLTGNYSLQLVSIRDIGIPQNIQENEFMRIDEEPEEGPVDEPIKDKKGNKQQYSVGLKEKHRGPRMLCLNLSDGKNIVKAIEYRPIPILKPDLAVGSQIMLIGPIEISFKVLLLQSKNIQIIGPPSKVITTLPTTSQISNDNSFNQSRESSASHQSSFSRSSIENDSKTSIKSDFVSLNPSRSSVEPLNEVNQSVVDLTNTVEDEDMFFFDDLDYETLE